LKILNVMPCTCPFCSKFCPWPFSPFSSNFGFLRATGPSPLRSSYPLWSANFHFRCAPTAFRYLIQLPRLVATTSSSFFASFDDSLIPCDDSLTVRTSSSFSCSFYEFVPLFIRCSFLKTPPASDPPIHPGLRNPQFS